MSIETGHGSSPEFSGELSEGEKARLLLNLADHVGDMVYDHPDTQNIEEENREKLAMMVSQTFFREAALIFKLSKSAREYAMKYGG